MPSANGWRNNLDIEIDRIWFLPLDESAGTVIHQARGVLGASKSAELRTDGMLRETSTAGVYMPPAQTTGDLPRLPVSGSDGRTVEVFVKASRGGLGDEEDAGIDDIWAQLSFRPCFLYVPTGAGS